MQRFRVAFNKIQFLNSPKRNSMISRRKFLKMQKVTQIRIDSGFHRLLKKDYKALM